MVGRQLCRHSHVTLDSGAHLVEQGARLDARTVEGWTPLALANGLSYSDFYKAQTQTADRLRELMQARGLATDGHHVDSSVCLDCFQTRPDQVRSREHVDPHATPAGGLAPFGRNPFHLLQPEQRSIQGSLVERKLIPADLFDPPSDIREAGPEPPMS